MRLFAFGFVLVNGAVLAWAQPPSCLPTSVPPLVRLEGYTERISDITYRCTAPGSSSFTGNLTIALNTEVTNRVGPGNTLLGINVTADNIPLANTPILVNSNTVTYNGLIIPFNA